MEYVHGIAPHGDTAAYGLPARVALDELGINPR
jgi:hypothetical protein